LSEKYHQKDQYRLGNVPVLYFPITGKFNFQPHGSNFRSKITLVLSAMKKTRKHIPSTVIDNNPWYKRWKLSDSFHTPSSKQNPVLLERGYIRLVLFRRRFTEMVRRTAVKQDRMTYVPKNPSSSK